MRALDLADVEHLLEGAVDVRRPPGSIRPIRYPAAEQAYYDPFTRWVASAPAGVRLRFKTDSRALHLAMNQRVAAFNGDPRPAPYDLFIDGKSFARKSVTGGAALAMD